MKVWCVNVAMSKKRVLRHIRATTTPHQQNEIHPVSNRKCRFYVHMCEMGDTSHLEKPPSLE